LSSSFSLYKRSHFDFHIASSEEHQQQYSNKYTKAAKNKSGEKGKQWKTFYWLVAVFIAA